MFVRLTTLVAPEVTGATALCDRSLNKLGLRYKKYLGDGDFKEFVAAMESKP